MSLGLSHRRKLVLFIVLVFGVAVFSLLPLDSAPAWSKGLFPSPIVENGDKRPSQNLHQPETPSATAGRTAATVLSIPPDYSKSKHESPYCAERFETAYLRTLSKSRSSYCDQSSKSSLTCFHSKTSDTGRVDNFCIGGPVISPTSDEDKLKLDCALVDQHEVPSFDKLLQYWYGTGPRYIFDNYVTLEEKKSEQFKPKEPRHFSVLVRREEIVSNPWHTLMQVFALYMTMDVLRMTVDPSTGAPFFSMDDVPNTRVVILDDYVDGPFHDLWTLFASEPIVRWNNATAEMLDGNQIIVPLAGASNPLWQGDWSPHACEQSDLVRTFSNRVLGFYDIDTKPQSEDANLTLTYVDRSDKRRLVDKEKYLEKLKSTYPNIKVNVVDFAKISLAEQLKIAQQTDILAGVHGAGLTNGMFLQPGSAMVEILPPTLNHKGFRNLAKLCSHQYFSSHATQREPDTITGDWQEDDIFIEEERFMALMLVAIKSMYNKRLVNVDIS